MFLKIIGSGIMILGGVTIISDPTMNPGVTTGSGPTQLLGLGIIGVGYFIYFKSKKTIND